jgi:hypothetical protein
LNILATVLWDFSQEKDVEDIKEKSSRFPRTTIPSLAI